MKPAVLVTGGAGYIGSHTSALLLRERYRVVIVDNLTTGSEQSVPAGATLVRANVRDTETVRKVIDEHRIQAVIHFAASLVVSESVTDPLKYYDNNVAATVGLLRAIVQSGVQNLVFSSTAAVYGETGSDPVTETAPTRPVSPYGRSKLMVEQIIQDTALASPLRYAILRYFNVAGAASDGQNGQRTRNATHLIKVACETALGKRPAVQVFGTDYPTPDGTGVRDYIHVEDLASAHLRAIEHLLKGGKSDLFNCGYGRGYSVLDVVKTLGAIAGREIPVDLAPRRPGDSPSVVADATKIRKTLGWKPEKDSLELICRSTLDWEKSLNR